MYPRNLRKRKELPLLVLCKFLFFLDCNGSWILSLSGQAVIAPMTDLFKDSELTLPALLSLKEVGRRVIQIIVTTSLSSASRYCPRFNFITPKRR